MGDFFRVLFSAFRGAAALFLILFLFFAALAAATLLLGFDLGDVDAWLDSHADWWSLIGDLLFKAICGLILLICLGTVGWGIVGRVVRDRSAMGEPAGCVAIGAAAVIGYFAWFGLSG